jgi:putative phosphoesterase
LRVIVFSDSHGQFEPLDVIVNSHPDACAFIHLGDGLREADDLRSLYPGKRIFCVRGNCDFFSDEKTEDIKEFGGIKIYFTHGHTQGVKRGFQRILHSAKEMGAKIACYGHTHCANSTISGGIHLLNPGSLSHSRCGGDKTYAVIDILDSGAQIDIVKF